MCGGLGFVIGIAVYLAWHKSEASWKRVVANVCACWMILSLAIYAFAFLAA